MVHSLKVPSKHRSIKISKVAIFVATCNQFNLKTTIRLLAVTLAMATAMAAHLKIQLRCF